MDGLPKVEEKPSQLQKEVCKWQPLKWHRGQLDCGVRLWQIFKSCQNINSTVNKTKWRKLKSLTSSNFVKLIVSCIINRRKMLLLALNIAERSRIKVWFLTRQQILCKPHCFETNLPFLFYLSFQVSMAKQQNRA